MPDRVGGQEFDELRFEIVAAHAFLLRCAFKARASSDVRVIHLIAWNVVSLADLCKRDLLAYPSESRLNVLRSDAASEPFREVFAPYAFKRTTAPNCTSGKVGIFEVLNVIVASTLGAQKTIDTLYAKLPEGALDAIERERHATP